jgi:orotidine-5'-phosphate decarboxylase
MSQAESHSAQLDQASRSKRSLSPRERLIVALDVSTMAEAKVLIEALASHVGMFKAGLELFTACGNEIFEIVEASGAKLFFDGKFHDIPNTVAGACRAVVNKGPVVSLFNLHAQGGGPMMEAAVAARNQAFEALVASGKARAQEKPALIAVTILTSMKAETLKSDLKVELSMEEMVASLALLTQKSGLDGVVASAREAEIIRKVCGPDFLIVTPGIRPTWASADDQARIVTPAAAIAGGADMIVVGRPITAAGSTQLCQDAAKRIVDELAGA